jgi:hypothetical protein
MPALFLATASDCSKLQSIMKDIYISDLAQFDEGKTFDGFSWCCRSSSEPPRTASPI